MPPALTRSRHVLMLLAALVTLAVVAAVALTSGSRGDAAGSGRPSAAASGAPGSTTKQSAAPTAPKRADTVRTATRATIHVATLNLKASMNVKGVTHDIREVITRGGPSVIGFQERGGSRAQMLAALPDHWKLVMPQRPHGADLNPVAYDDRVWELQRAWPALLTDHTWRRARGNMAIAQYAVVATLQHRATGRVIRAASFHMPPRIHNQSGGPNYGLRPRVEAFWRMASSVDRLARSTPRTAQFVAMCDCNVSAARDRTNELLEGKVIRPLDLRTNYDVRGNGTGMSIDYVMTPRRGEVFGITDFVRLEGLMTDHPGIVTKLKESRHSFKDRMLVERYQLLITRENASVGTAD